MADLVPVQLIVDLTRILYGAAFLGKLWTSIDARELVWAHRPPRGLTLLLGLQALSAVCFTLGLFTGPACVLLFTLNLWLNRAASFYGLEDISFQFISFYFLFSGAGRRLCLDRSLGLDLSLDPFGDPRLGLSLLTLMFAGVLFAAGIGKVRCPLWRRGLGTYVFFLSPIYRKFDLSFLVRSEPLMRALNFLTIGFQLGLLPALLQGTGPLGALLFAGAAGFCLSLAAVFTLTWIGEVLTIILPAVGWLIFSLGGEGLAPFLLHSWPGLDPIGRWTMAGALLSIAVGLRVCVAPAPAALQALSRFTWGLSQVTVFTAKDFVGPVIFRVFAGTEEVFRVFLADCGFGPERFWKPIFIEGMSLKITEVCEELDLHGEVRNPERLQLMRRIAEHVRRKSFTASKAPPSLEFRVLQLVHPQSYEGISHWYLHQAWVWAFRVRFDGSRAAAVEPLTKNILSAPTGRDLSRSSFAFSAKP